MAKKRALKDAAKDPIAEKGLPALESHPVAAPGSGPGVATIVITMGIGIIVGLVGGLLSKRLIRMLF
jgi:hypothetical protein